jgi:predicted GNAT superfamily acetyltransferase
MPVELRELKTHDEMRECLKLQGEIWGLTDLGKTSPITLSSLTIQSPRTGFILGWFLGGRMIATSIIMGTFEPGTVFGRMFGILPEYRNVRVGREIHQKLFPYLVSHGVSQMVWAYEPLEGRNANLYLNRSGGEVFSYNPDFYLDVDEMSSGMPADRFLVRSDLNSERTRTALSQGLKVPSVDDALARYPVATASSFPDRPSVLVRIPGELQDLKRSDPAAAMAFRMETRTIFSEYINIRHYRSRALITGVTNGGRVNWYLLEKDG